MSLADLEIIRAFMRNAHEIDDEELTEEEVEELKRQGKRSGDGRVNKKKEDKETSKEEREYDQAQAQKADSVEVEKGDAESPSNIRFRRRRSNGAFGGNRQVGPQRAIAPHRGQRAVQ